MSEAVALELLHLLLVAFPPLAALLGRFLPDVGTDPLVDKIRGILPLVSKSGDAVRELEKREFMRAADLDSTIPPALTPDNEETPA